MSPVLDDRGRLFGKVSLIDILVVLLLIALVAFGYARFRGGAGEDGPVSMTLRIERQRLATVDKMVEAFGHKETIYDDSGTALGTVESVTHRATKEQTTDSSGNLHVRDSALDENGVPLYQDIDILVEGSGARSGKNIRIGSVTIAVGKQLTLRGNGVDVKALVWSVK